MSKKQTILGLLLVLLLTACGSPVAEAPVPVEEIFVEAVSAEFEPVPPVVGNDTRWHQLVHSMYSSVNQEFQWELYQQGEEVKIFTWGQMHYKYLMTFETGGFFVEKNDGSIWGPMPLDETDFIALIPLIDTQDGFTGFLLAVKDTDGNIWIEKSQSVLTPENLEKLYDYLVQALELLEMEVDI